MPDAHDPTTCNGVDCGQTDDHPKIHVAGTWVQDPDAEQSVIVRNPSFHFDCLPPEWAARYQDDPTHANLVATREAALGGTHGQDLRDHIATLPDDNVPTEA